MIVFIIILFVLGGFSYLILSVLLIKDNKENEKKVLIHKPNSTIEIVKQIIDEFFISVKNKDYNKLSEICTERFRKLTWDFTTIKIEYDEKKSIFIEKDTINKIEVLIVGDCVDIRNNRIIFNRINDNDVRIDEVL